VDASDSTRLAIPANTAQSGFTGALYAEGYLLFGGDQGLVMAQPFNLQSLSPAGPPVSLGVRTITPNSWSALAVAGTTLVLPGLLPAPGGENRLAWLNRQGRQLSSGPPTSWSFRLSHDGIRVAMTAERDLWLYEAGRDARISLTAGSSQAGNAQNPVWSPDDRRVAFRQNDPEGREALLVTTADGTRQERKLFDAPNFDGVSDWSPDGRRLILNLEPAELDQRADLWLYSFDDGKVTPLIQSRFVERDARISPDGRWMAYVSDESGEEQVCVRSFPDAGPAKPISAKGGWFPAWRRDGAELYYFEPGGRLIAVPIAKGKDLAAGKPTPLFEIPGWSLTPARATVFDASPDGQRFLVNVSRGFDTVRVIQSWPGLLKTRVDK